MDSKDTTFKQTVLLLCNDLLGNNQNGTVWERNDNIDHREFGMEVELFVKHKPSASVLFRLSTIKQPILLYLQITPDRFLSLEKTIYDDNNKIAHPPYLHVVREKMGMKGTKGDVMCFQFVLNRPGDLLVPNDFISHGCEMKQRHEVRSFMSLATSSTFSLYMQPNVLPHRAFSVFHLAIKHWSDTTQDQKERFNQMSNHRSLYGGKGGKLYKPMTLAQEDSATTAASISTNTQLCKSPPPYDFKGDGSHSPEGSESDIATVASSTPPRYRFSHHDSGRNQTRSTRGAMPDATEVMGDQLLDDHYLPAYKFHSASSTCTTENTSKRRKLNLDCDRNVADRDAKSGSQSTSTKAKDGAGSHTAISRNSGANLDFQVLVTHIDKMQQQIEYLMSQNKEYEQRLSFMENTQDQTRDNLDLLSAEVDDVQSDLTNIGEQLQPDIREEVESWACENLELEMKRYVDTWVEENLEYIVQTWIGEHMESEVSRSVDACVKASFVRQTNDILKPEQWDHMVNKITADVKDRIRSALET